MNSHENTWQIAGKRTQGSTRPLWARRLGSGIWATLPIAILLSLISAPAAYAATYIYSNWLSTAEHQVRYSGAPRTLVGGYVELEAFAPGGAQPMVLIESYRPAPGYQIYGFNTGGGYATMYHTAASGAYQKCYWDWPYWSGNIGNLDMLCQAYY